MKYIKQKHDIESFNPAHIKSPIHTHCSPVLSVTMIVSVK